MAILGAHQSIAGGFYRAIERARDRGCDCTQIFTKNTNQWRAREIASHEVEQFRKAVADLGVSCPLAHDSYLVNLASPDPALWRRSVDALVAELLRANMLGIPWVVAHPGAYGASSEADGIARTIEALGEVLDRTAGREVGCLVETTAGQGSSLGWRFEHLAKILDGVRAADRLGVCFDTCHVFAAGYELTTRVQYRTTMKLFDEVVGLEQIRAFHLNDSRKPCGSRVDRHAHIGAGCLGLEAFRHLLRDRRFRRVPMVMETPKSREGEKPDWDVVNLQRLRELVED
jgi:deoxyribonuclease IV